MNFPIHDLPLFMLAALLVNLTPGPDMLFVMGSGAAHGRRAGVMASLGVGAGCMLHTLLAAVGLSALLAASALAFDIVKWVGAAYLVWVGLGMLRSRATPQAVLPPTLSPRRAFWQGALTNALNPKVALFFLAFLPQFITQGESGQTAAFLLLGTLFNVGGTVVNTIAALLASGVRHRLSGSSASGRFATWARRVAGTLFIGLGLKLGLTTR